MPNLDKMILAAIALIWGFNFVVIRWGIEDLDPLIMTVLRFTIVALPAIFFFKKPNVPMVVIAIYGFLFGGALWGVVNLAVALGTPAGLASILLQFSAFFTVLVGAVFFKEPFPLNKKLGVGIALLGLSIIALSKGTTFPVIGLFLMLIAATSWTICNAMLKLFKPRDAVAFVVWSSLFVPVPILILSLGFNSLWGNEVEFATMFQWPSIKGWISILFQAILTTLLGYSVWTSQIKKNGLSNVAPYSLLVPVSGIFFGWLCYGEIYDLQVYIGVILVLSGIAINSADRVGAYVTKYFGQSNVK